MWLRRPHRPVEHEPAERSVRARVDLGLRLQVFVDIRDGDRAVGSALVCCAVGVGGDRRLRSGVLKLVVNVADDRFKNILDSRDL